MNNNGNALERLYTVEQVAELFSLKKKTLYAWAEQGRIPCFKIGKALRFRESELREFIEASRIPLTDSETQIKVRAKQQEGS
ncbi:MAG: helix-turn-helix domain-containing protein [Acidobacteria bacterium]|nr:helix-turn-helix domain-containing protein [Acidobacteriota bacterium]